MCLGMLRLVEKQDVALNNLTTSIWVSYVNDTSSRKHVHFQTAFNACCFISIVFAEISWVKQRHSSDEQQKAMGNSSEDHFCRDLIEQK